MKKIDILGITFLLVVSVALAGCLQQDTNGNGTGNGTDDGSGNGTTDGTGNGNDDGTENGTGDGSTGELKEFTIEGFEFGYTPETITVNEGDTVRITFKNTGTMIHNLIIDEFNAATETIPAGAEDTIEFTASQKGNFAFYCSVGRHRALGMEGTIIVQ